VEPAAPTTELVTFPPWPAIPLTAPVTLPASLTTPVTVLAMVPVTPPASAGVRVAVLLTLPTVLPTEVPAGEAALVVPLAADFTGLAEVVTVLEAAEVTCEATGVTAATDPAAIRHHRAQPARRTLGRCARRASQQQAYAECRA